jgi:hypothetical protein
MDFSNVIIVTTANNKLYSYSLLDRLPECGSLTLRKNYSGFL